MSSFADSTPAPSRRAAWLRGRQFRLGRYRPSPANPLPDIPEGWQAPTVIALDLPQGLPRPGLKRRVADARASVPTSGASSSRADLETWRLYRGLVEAGIEAFWSIRTSSSGVIAAPRDSDAWQAIARGDLPSISPKATVAGVPDPVQTEGSRRAHGTGLGATDGGGARSEDRARPAGSAVRAGGARVPDRRAPGRHCRRRALY